MNNPLIKRIYQKTWAISDELKKMKYTLTYSAVERWGAKIPVIHKINSKAANAYYDIVNGEIALFVSGKPIFSNNRTTREVAELVLMELK